MNLSNSNSRSRFPSSIARARTYNHMVFWVLMLFEAFAISSDYEGLMRLWGHPLWSRLLAFSLAAIDFAGFAKLYSPELRAMKEAFWTLAAAWVITLFGDTFLTVMAVAPEMQASAAHNALVQSGVISLHTYTVVLPIGFAIFTCVLQMLLVAKLTFSIKGEA